MARDIDLSKKLSDEDRQYLIDRARLDLVAANDLEFSGETDVPVGSGLPVGAGTDLNSADRNPEAQEAHSAHDPQLQPGSEALASLMNRPVDDLGSGAQEAPAPAPEDGYEDLTNEELREELESRGLTKSGNKEELIARLREADAQN